MDMFDLGNARLGLSGSVETLYTQVQKVYLKSKRGDEKCRNLRVTVDIRSGLPLSSGKVLSVQITDDNDCLLFYSLILTQEDFRVLKAQQGLLVDFANFPSQLVKLLEVCRSQDLPKFVLVLDEEDTDTSHDFQSSVSQHSNDGVYFKVIETNNFKNLCHLSLKVLQGTDSDIKNHMSNKIANLVEKLTNQQKRANVAEANLTEALKALEMKSKELTDVQMKLSEEKNCIRLESSHQISEEREKYSRLQLEWQRRLDSQKALLDEQHQKTVNEMNEQINLLTFNNKNLYEGKCLLETSIKEKNYQIEALDKQIIHITQDLSLLRKQNAQLDQDYHEKDKTVISMKTRLAVLEQEVKDKTKLLDKHQELLRAANEQKVFLEEALNDRDNHLQRKLAKLQNLSADLMKSNEIITKLQTDLTANKAKMKLRTDIALEQERILEKKTQQIAEQMETIKQLEDKVEKLTKELTLTKQAVEDAKRILEEKEVVIKKNDNVINWLNRRLIESTSPPATATTSNLTSASRVGGDTLSGTLQTKSQISNLTKGWPPWLINSVAGNSGQIPAFRKEPDQETLAEPVTGVTSSSSNPSRPASTSTPYELTSDHLRGRLYKLDENSQPGEKRISDEAAAKENSGTKVKGLDPKYFQACTDRDPPPKAQILKLNNGKSDRKNPTTSLAGKPNSGRAPTSAYFPRKTVLL